MTRRAAGLLLHVTSLPGRFGIGDLGPDCDRFLEWAASAQQSLWQILPLQPAGDFGSPYGGISAFAGNPLLLSPERLVEEGLLSGEAIEVLPSMDADRVEFASVGAWKRDLLKKSWLAFRAGGAPGAQEKLEEFRRSPLHSFWLDDWTLFAALKERFGPVPWTAWPREIALREPAALIAARRELEDEIAYSAYLQFLFFRQWERVRSRARDLGVAILGDVPIYLSHDSADVWAHADLFALDAEGQPVLVAGVPPDYFSETGQLWGYPVYRWDRMEEQNFAWWTQRLRAALSLTDLVRIDHFRGFCGYWAVPAGSADARNGQWLAGPGQRLFDALANGLERLPIIAEDLGTITQDVEKLLAELAIPGMRVLQFAFSEEDSPHAPHRHVRNCVVYTGTHDNDTARGWFAELSQTERARVHEYLGSDGREIEWDLIRAAYASVADRAIVPVQDVLGLGGQARMNTPSRAENNWSWRARRTDFTAERAARLARLARLTGRSPIPPAGGAGAP